MKLYYLITIFFLTYPLQSFAQDAYPEWFLSPEKYPDIITGFSYNRQPPVVDAERMYCVYQECIVEGTLERFQNTDSRNSDYYYNFSPDSLNAVKGNLFPVDSFSTHILSNSWITAFALDTSANVSQTSIMVDSLKTPDWINQSFYQKDGYYYGVGMFTSRANDNDAWKTAEEHAFYSIMSSIAIEFYSIKILNTSESDDDTIENFNAVKLNFRLKELEVIERYPDEKHDLFYVLVRIKKENVFSPLMKKSK